MVFKQEKGATKVVQKAEEASNLEVYAKERVQS